MNKVAHFELAAKDRDKLGSFYTDLFGWHTESFPEMDYVVIDTHAGNGINGGIGPAHGGPKSSIYVEVPDLRDTLDHAVTLGAAIVMEPEVVPGVVSLAIFTDPQGNMTGLVKSEAENESTGPSDGSNPAVSWFEILGPDPKGLRDFYADLFEWEFESSDASDIEYYQVMAGIGGGVGASPDGDPHSTSYAEVDDLQAYLDKAASLGGAAIVPPMDMGEVAFAQFADPEGIVFGLYKRN